MEADYFSRFWSLARDLALRGLEPWLHVDAAAEAVTRDRPSVLVGVPAARLLLAVDDAHRPAASQLNVLGEGFKRLAALSEGVAASGDAIRLFDLAGHARPVYHPLAIHLYLAAHLLQREYMADVAREQNVKLMQCIMRQPMRMATQFATLTRDASLDGEDVPLALWWALCVHEYGQATGTDYGQIVESIVSHILAHPGADGCLHPITTHDSLDTWTYRELVGLHALATLASRSGNLAWQQRVEEVAMYHLENTQPDNVTNQPWAVYAFAASIQTLNFAEQQLHDVTAHGVVNTTGVGVASAGSPGSMIDPVAAMLLADAVAGGIR